MNNNARQEKADSGKSSGKSSVVKQEQVEGAEEEHWEVEEGELGWWEWSNIGMGMHQLEWHENAEAEPEIWEPGQSSSSSSGAAVCAPTAMPAKKGKRNHGQKAKKSPPLLH